MDSPGGRIDDEKMLAAPRAVFLAFVHDVHVIIARGKNLGYNQRSKRRPLEDLARARLEAYTAVVKLLTGQQFEDELHLW